MGNSYSPELWRDFFVVLSSSSAALIGLLFIATSLHLNEIANNPVLRRRAYYSTCYLLIAFVDAVLVLVPQPMFILGAELVAINLFGAWLALRITYTFFRNQKDFRHGGATIHRAVIFIGSFLLGIAGGAALIERLNWGIYLVAICSVGLLVGVVLGAWAITLAVGQSEK